MAYDRFMIAPINTGLQQDVKPFLIPDDAFARLQNAYVFRGRVRKRFGSRLLNGSVSPAVAQLYSRLRIVVNTTDGAGNASGTVPGVIFAVGQVFSIGDEIFTVVSSAPGAQPMLTTGASVTHTYDIGTGAYVFVGADANTDVYFYPATPVMGLISYEVIDINDEPLFAFDTQFAYQRVNGGWARLGTAVWTGNDAQFFWGCSYRGIEAYDNYLFVTNFNPPDQIKYWDGASWTTFAPVFNAAGDIIETARIIVAFKDRLLFLNTVESISSTNHSFVNRLRFSQNGSPVQSDAWREDIPGKGGYLDAPTKEQIITAQFLKDRLIVYFESSTWELVYTGNEILPFRWQQINTELGAESTFSQVPFDKAVIGVGNVGIHACNGANVERIDDKIPDAVFEIHNENDGVVRVNGIRDYFLEMVYWTFPSAEGNPTYPNRVLVYNYRNSSWAFNDDSITCFGYYQDQNDVTWESTALTWAESIDPWDTGALQALFQYIVGGNQEGFVFIIDSDNSRNAPALSITNITGSSSATLTIINHNLSNEDYVIVENAQGITSLNNNVYPVTVVDDNTIRFNGEAISGTYTGGGTIARVSRIDILTKQYNFYMNSGRNAYVAKVDFYVDKTVNGQITVDSYASSSTISLREGGLATGSIIGTGVLETKPYPVDMAPLEQSQARIWHPVYLQAEGEVVQLNLYLSPEQLVDTDIAWSDFELNAMTFYCTPTTSRLQ